MAKGGNASRVSVRDLLRVPPGSPPRLAEVDARGTPGLAGRRRRDDAAAQASHDTGALARLQERLYAESTVGGRRRVLLVLQGMDTSGKDGTVKHVVGALNPLAVDVTGFREPTPEERRHDFLWRIRPRVPAPGRIGVFNRSHYEDVLVPRVHATLPERAWEPRHATINAFEASLVETGVTLVKVFLHISRDEQRDRLLARLDDPSKRWKFSMSDVRSRSLWPAYWAAYEDVIARCATAAPWYVVPADRKWYRNWAVGRLLRETLEDLDPRYPQPEIDEPAARAALAD